MLSLNDVLELPVVRRALPEVVVGDRSLDREIRWAHVIEMPDPDDLLKGGELVLTTGLGASVTSNLQPGTYYLRVDNTGYGDPLNTGYSTYGSRGAYTLGITPS